MSTNSAPYTIKVLPNPNLPASLSFSPAGPLSLQPSGSVQAETVTVLTGSGSPVPNGTVVTLVSDQPTRASVPATATVAGGAGAATFNVTPGASSGAFVITATAGAAAGTLSGDVQANYQDALITGLGGDANVGVLAHTRIVAPTTAAEMTWPDVRGGANPSFVTSGSGAVPTYDATSKAIINSGTSRVLHTPTSSKFNLGAGRCFAAISTDNAGQNYDVGAQRSTGSDYAYLNQPGNANIQFFTQNAGSVDSLLPRSATKRLKAWCIGSNGHIYLFVPRGISDSPGEGGYMLVRATTGAAHASASDYAMHVGGLYVDGFSSADSFWLAASWGVTTGGLFSGTNLKALYDYAMATEPGLTAVDPKRPIPAVARIVYLGDSITYGHEATAGNVPAGSEYPAVVKATAGLTQGVGYLNPSVSGRHASQWNTRWTGDVDAAAAVFFTAAGNKLQVIMAGSNDVSIGNSAATVLGNIQGLCTKWHALGASYKNVVLPVLSRNYGDAGKEAVRVELNGGGVNGIGSLIASGHADAVVTLPTSLTDPTAYNNANFQDQIHPTVAGHALIAGALAPVLAGLL